MPPVPRIDQGLRGAGAVPGRSLCVQRAVLQGGGHPLQPPCSRAMPQPPQHSYLLFTVRNMDLLMSVPTPLLAWHR